MSPARTHTLITEDVAEVASFERLLRAELGPYEAGGRTRLDGPGLKRIEEDATGTWLAWTWNEHDGPPPTLPAREGFGTRLLKRF